MCFQQTKHVYFKLKQYVPNIRTSICSWLFFFPPSPRRPACHFFLFCVRWMIGNKLQDIYSGSTFPCFHILKVFLFLLFVSGCTGLARKNVVGCHRRAPWKRFAAAFRQRRKKVRNGGGGGGQRPSFQVFSFCVSAFRLVAEKSHKSLRSSIGRSKLNFLIYNWNILVGSWIKFFEIRLIKTSGLVITT